MSFSQSSYPKKILWNNDTVLAITGQQLIKINRAINRGRFLEEYVRVLSDELELADSFSLYWRRVAMSNDSVSLLYARQVSDTQELVHTLENSLKENDKKTRKTSIGVGVGGVALGILLGALIIK